MKNGSAIIKAYRFALQRRQPYGLLTWRYLLPNKCDTLKNHRQAFLHFCTRKPRLIWPVIVAINYAKWYLFESWRQIFRFAQRYSAQVTVFSSIPLWKQFLQLTHAAIGYTILPREYYRYQLYRYPSGQWLHFVYNQELPEWHLMQSPNISEKSRQLITHKHHFAETGRNHNLPVIQSIALFEKGGEISESSLFSKTSLFFKPESGSRLEGCMALTYHSKTDRYTLTHADGTLTHKAAIRKAIKDKITEERYLAQPLLQNNQWLSELLPDLPLATFRVITMIKSGRPEVVSAVMEISLTDNIKQAQKLSINIQTGQLASRWMFEHMTNEKRGEAVLASLGGKKLPVLTEMDDIVRRAHSLCPDIYAVGWDLAWSSRGLKLIEGNLNWDVAWHQDIWAGARYLAAT